VFSSRQGSEGFEISIPAKQTLALNLMVGPALALCGMAEALAVWNVLLGPDDRVSAQSLTVRLIAWTCASAFLLYLQFWMVIGKELVILRPTSLLIRRELGGFDRSQEYDLLHVRNLRVASSAKWGGALHFLGIGSGPIAFDYRSKTVRFGSGLPDAEARAIVNELRSQYAFPETAG
jgi:hypothetical protein